MRKVQVWRGAHADPEPLFGPLPGIRSGDTLAYEFELDTATAIDGLRRWQRFLDRHLHADRYPQADWTDFPPARIQEFTDLPTPLGPIVTSPG